MLNRRALLALPLGFLPVRWVHAEPPKVIGVLSSFPLREFDLMRPILQRAMRELGYLEGRDFVLVGRFAEGRIERLPALAAELVKMRVDLILAAPTIAAQAAQLATSTIPVVFERVADPVLAGIADSVAHPGRNLTGVSNFALDLDAKRFQLLLQMVPSLKHVAILANSASPYFASQKQQLESAGDAYGVRSQVVSAATVEEIESGFQTMVRSGAQAVSVWADAFLWPERQRIADLALRHRLPSIGPFEEFVQVGGLMSYGVDQSAELALAASYIDKIFRGAKPGELPILQPTRMDLVINRKTAEALGLAVPQVLLLQAHKVVG